MIKESEKMKNIKVICVSAMLVFGLAGCGSTLEGAKADIYDTRKVISDFVKPSETSVAITVANTPKKEKAVD